MISAAERRILGAMTPQEVVSRECQLIPDDTSAQRLLRAAYAVIRQAGLAKNPESPTTRKGAIDRAVEIIQSNQPDFMPRYDAWLNTQESF